MYHSPVKTDDKRSDQKTGRGAQLSKNVLDIDLRFVDLLFSFGGGFFQVRELRSLVDPRS